MNYEQMITELKVNTKRRFPEAYFVNVDLGRFTGYLVIRFIQEDVGPKYNKVLNRFGDLDEMLSRQLDGDLLDYVIRVEFNVQNGNKTEMVIEVAFGFDGLVLN